MDLSWLKPYHQSERTLVPAEDTYPAHQENDPYLEVPASTEETQQPVEPIDLAKRTGIHYFPDTDHYSHADLERWVPIIQNLGVSWVVLPAPTDRSIPQEFFDALVGSDIKPVIHFTTSLADPGKADDLKPLLQAYANWGVKYAVFFDQPNLRSQWPQTGWTQRGLVSRFLDIFVPFASAAVGAGLSPVFPALEPGGDFWDTAFLRAALEELMKRHEEKLLSNLVIGAYAWTGDKSMTYGAGGPENWPATMPYHTPENSEDQRGFRIFDWYNSVSRAVLGKELPLILIGAGVGREEIKPLDAPQGTRAIKMAETLLRNPDPTKNNTVPANVLACNFWILSANPETPEATTAWYKINGKPTKAADEWMAWKLAEPNAKAVSEESARHPKDFVAPSLTELAEEAHPSGRHAINHYLLLPSVTDWPVDAIRAFVMETKVTMGISEQEAASASRVTLAGSLESFSDELLRNLIQAGCQVEMLPIGKAA